MKDLLWMVTTSSQAIIKQAIEFAEEKDDSESKAEFIDSMKDLESIIETKYLMFGENGKQLKKSMKEIEDGEFVDEPVACPTRTPLWRRPSRG